MLAEKRPRRSDCSSRNYTNTVFSSATGLPSITTGNPPFTGTYAPQQAFSNIAAAPVAGTWTLIVVDDDATGVSGVFGSFTISFTCLLARLRKFSWTSTPTGFTSGVQNPPGTVSPMGNTAYNGTYTATNGCTATSTVNCQCYTTHYCCSRPRPIKLWHGLLLPLRLAGNLRLPGQKQVFGRFKAEQ